MGNILTSRFFRIYIIPGCIIQSVMVGGGYGTGREVVEYFTQFGFLGGLYAILIAFILMAIVFALTFELARISQSYNYRDLMRVLLGRGWVVFDILTLLFLPLILAVLAAASGTILEEHLGINYWLGLACIMLVIGFLTFHGRELITKVLTLWSFFLYAGFIGFIAIVFYHSSDNISASFSQGEILPGWSVSGMNFAMYNLIVVPLVLYCCRPIESRKEAVTSGLVAAVISLLPAVMFHIAFIAFYPDIKQQELPVYWVLDQYGMKGFLLLYTIMLFGTFIETGAGVLQGINDRIDSYMLEVHGKKPRRSVHALTAIVAIFISSLLSTWGITQIIGQGYSTAGWFYFAIFVIPLCTLGLWKIIKSP